MPRELIAKTVPILDHQDHKGREIRQFKFELVNKLPPFDAQIHSGMPLFVQVLANKDFGFWLGSALHDDWVRAEAFGVGATNTVDTLVELTAIPAIERVDKMRIFVKETSDTWFFDINSTIDPATNPDDIQIPDDVTHPAPGRWFKISPNEAEEIAYVVPTPHAAITPDLQDAVDFHASLTQTGTRVVVRNQADFALHYTATNAPKTLILMPNASAYALPSNALLPDVSLVAQSWNGSVTIEGAVPANPITYAGGGTHDLSLVNLSVNGRLQVDAGGVNLSNVGADGLTLNNGTLRTSGFRLLGTFTVAGGQWLMDGIFESISLGNTITAGFVFMNQSVLLSSLGTGSYVDVSGTGVLDLRDVNLLGTLPAAGGITASAGTVTVDNVTYSGGATANAIFVQSGTAVFKVGTFDRGLGGKPTGTFLGLSDGSIFENEYVEEVSLTTTTSTAFITKLTHTTAALEGLFEVHWEALVSRAASGANGEGHFKLRNSTDSNDHNGVEVSRGLASEVQRVGGMKRVLFSGAAKVFDLQWLAVTGLAAVGIQEARIWLERAEP